MSGLARMSSAAVYSLCAALAIAGLTAASAADDRRWRVFEHDEGALLSPSRSDEATDDVGSPSFRCKAKSGTMTATGEASQELRNAVADLLRSNGYPHVEMAPASRYGQTLLNVSYSEAGSVWEYSFELEADAPSFEAFKRTGRLTFKVGKTTIREELKPGLENVAKFQSICARPK
ncbi:hypothetical protein; putative signal peptide [Bradyrhizobium sp. ORS 278]|uniref:hypothetical protein n=1 Tax=Bradyrhizobium sp. (strain ORS 278) TaxID=114615 RepID=UPI00015075EA|nr:hypothetical protein [Bradyrhizobium sp. ORS 278]CAL74954.1 hypothetical protein; putative signal peptide [Bradyrhizobium sp. ORS 278]